MRDHDLEQKARAALVRCGEMLASSDNPLHPYRVSRILRAATVANNLLRAGR